MAKTRMSIDASQFDALMQTVGNLPAEVSQYVRKTAMLKAVALVEATMKATAPVGKDSDRRKQSKKHKAKWAGTPKLKDAIGSAIRDYETNSFTAFVGVEHPWGAKSNFDYQGTKSREMSFWGRKGTGRIRKKFRWMVRVGDMTARPVAAIFEKAIDDGVKMQMARRKP